MPGLHVHRSNRLETLASSLAELTSTPLGGPLEPEVVVVQSLGMRRWLSFELAQRLGVTMNVRFPFPAGFSREVFRAAFGEIDEDATFAREILPWRVMALFPRWIDRPGWEPLRAYLQGEREGLKRYQLAHKIAAVFDRYLAYRPELLIEWDAQRRREEWQAQLWRELTQGRRDSHPPALLDRLQDRDASLPLPGLPARVAVFGISSLPPFYLHLLQFTSRHLDLHLFLLEPTDQYWGDIESRREQDRRLARSKATAEELHLDSGNALLASLGKVGRDFTRLVQDLEPVSIRESFTPPAPTTLLARLQADIFEMRERAPDEREPLAEPDGTVRIHCCHGPMREVEVLHDQLLDLFERIPGLTPRDILVAAPDVEVYTPFIQAVFGCAEDPRHDIPFSVADRSARAESSVADTFLRLLDLHGSRFGAASVIALLDNGALRRRFGIEPGDLSIIRRWIATAGIRWGIDADQRASLDLPAFADNSWRAGLDRLLLGYALPGDDRTLFEGVLPTRDVEGALATTLGDVTAFLETAFERIPRLGTPRSLADWSAALLQLVQLFFDDADESADEVRHLRETIARMAQDGATAGLDALLDFEVIRAHLDTALADTDSGTGFLAGGVTFCSLKPMRAIPFKVICLLGMNDTAFPRRDTALAFDLLSTGKPRRGDRSQRDDDRQLFFEAILSAREVFYVSHSGVSPRDNSEAPPSVVVSELLDYLEQNFALPAGDIRKALVTRHRLQAFSPAYFTAESKLFSYSAENARSSEQTRAERAAVASFASSPLPEPGEEWNAVALDQLAEFFANPARFFCRKRLGLAKREEIAALEECEPLDLAGLEKYGLGQKLTQFALEGVSLEDELPAVRASGLLPHGYAGDSKFAELRGRASALAGQIRRLAAEPFPTPLTVDIDIAPWRVTGLLQGIHPAGLVRHRLATLKSKDFLRTWVEHLALQFAGGPRATLLLGDGAAWRFRPIDDARPLLADLLALYAEGLRSPLPLFPESSLEFARRTLRPKPRERADPRAKAREIWEGGQKNRPENADFWLGRCFTNATDPFDERWEDVARRVFGPLLDAREEVPL